MRFIHFLFLAIFSSLYVLIKTPALIKAIKPIWFNEYQFGDLYRYSYLKAFKDTTLPFPTPKPQPESRKINLFMLGDSFGGGFGKGNFPNAAQYSFANWNHIDHTDISLKLDTQAINVLVLESVEKHLLLRLGTNLWKRYCFPIANVGSEDSSGFVQQEKPISFWQRVENTLGRSKITDQNVQFIMLSNPLAVWFKEQKAAFHFAAFHKTASEVVYLPKQNMLIQQSTTDPSYKYMSSFRKVPESEKKACVNNLKHLTEYYISKGFDSVIIGMVPNTISVVSPQFNKQQYHGLIPYLEERIEGTGIISVYPIFSKLKEKVYRRGDTHWNVKGAGIWQDSLNASLENLARRSTK